MSRTAIHLNVKKYNGGQWAQLSDAHEGHMIVAEKISKKDDNFSFIGGHRVRLYSFKKNVHWLLPTNIETKTLDISNVSSAKSPRRGQG